MGYIPLGHLHYGFWYSFLSMSVTKRGMKMLSMKQPTNPIWKGMDKTIKIYVGSIAVPNFLRSLSLHFTSSNIHYYGDVEEGNVVKQCQIWTDWRMKLFALTLVADMAFITLWCAPPLLYSPSDCKKLLLYHA